MQYLQTVEWVEEQEDGSILYCAYNVFRLTTGQLQRVYSDSDGLSTVERLEDQTHIRAA